MRYTFSFRESSSDKRREIVLSELESKFLAEVNPKFSPDHPVITLIYRAMTGKDEITIRDISLTEGL